MRPEEKPTKLVLVVSEDWYYWSHRRPIALRAIELGWDVTLVTRLSDCREKIEADGVRVVAADLRRGSLNPWRDIGYLRTLLRVYRNIRPTLVHHVAMKPCLYGSIAARMTGVPSVVNALAGMGYLFTSSGISARLIRPLLLVSFRCFLGRRNCRLILQNADDVATFRDTVGIRQDRICRVPGSGVDLSEFRPAAARPDAGRVVCVTMISRLLHDKGVLELIEAARLLKRRGVHCCIRIVGDADADNPNAIDREVLASAAREGIVELPGRRSDVAQLYQASDIAVLPSYREGLPKSLAEAAACGLPIVTTDVPGCRQVVEDGVNGILVPPREAGPLADAIERLVRDAELRRTMGAASRRRAEREFGLDRIVVDTFDVYQSVMGHDLTAAVPAGSYST